jgi:hypothetical protein
MKSRSRQILITAALLVLPLVSHADNVEVKGTGTTQYEGGFFGSANPSEKEKQLALASAKMTAWKNFVARLNPAEQAMIQKNDVAVRANMDRFISDVVILDTQKDLDMKTLTIAVRVSFNDEVVRQFVQGLSVGNGQYASRSKDSLFSFLFMARKQTSIKQFDAKRSDVRQGVAAGSVHADGSVSAQVMLQSGGSTEHKEDAVSWAVSSSQDLDAAMGEVVASSGIEYVGYDDIVSNCAGMPVKKFQNEYVGSDEMSPKTRSQVLASARACEVRYFATGTIDTGVASVDPVSGNQRVFVSVRAQLWDISGRLPRKVGSVGPKQYAGLGPDQSVAGRNALADAARETAKILVDQLNAKGIR